MKMSSFYLEAAAFLVFAAPALADPAVESLMGPNDRQIAAIVAAANMAEISAGSYVWNLSEDGNIKKFAEQMVKESSALSKSTSALASKFKITPEKSDSSRAMEMESKKNLATLGKLSGHELDKVYLQQEVSADQSVLDTIDKSLLPNVSNVELKNLLEKTRPAIAARLELARKLAGTM